MAAILPSSRSVVVGSTAAAFATIINAGTIVAASCLIAPTTAVPSRFVYQTTNPSTNVLSGAANKPVDIAPGAAQTFAIAFVPTARFSPTDVGFTFACINATAALSNSDINTLLLSSETTPVPDIIALAASGDPGIVDIPASIGAGAFAVATTNVGVSAVITATATTGGAALPISIALCQTDPRSGQCLTATGPSATVMISANSTPTFGIFVASTNSVPFLPVTNRVFVRFTDASGVVRGSTSVAVRTN